MKIKRYIMDKYSALLFTSAGDSTKVSLLDGDTVIKSINLDKPFDQVIEQFEESPSLYYHQMEN